MAAIKNLDQRMKHMFDTLSRSDVSESEKATLRFQIEKLAETEEGLSALAKLADDKEVAKIAIKERWPLFLQKDGQPYIFAIAFSQSEEIQLMVVDEIKREHPLAHAFNENDNCQVLHVLASSKFDSVAVGLMDALKGHEADIIASFGGLREVLRDPITFSFNNSEFSAVPYVLSPVQFVSGRPVICLLIDGNRIAVERRLLKFIEEEKDENSLKLLSIQDFDRYTVFQKLSLSKNKETRLRIFDIAKSKFTVIKDEGFELARIMALAITCDQFRDKEVIEMLLKEVAARPQFITASSPTTPFRLCHILACFKEGQILLLEHIKKSRGILDIVKQDDGMSVRDLLKKCADGQVQKALKEIDTNSFN